MFSNGVSFRHWQPVILALLQPERKTAGKMIKTSFWKPEASTFLLYNQWRLKRWKSTAWCMSEQDNNKSTVGAAKWDRFLLRSIWITFQFQQDALNTGLFLFFQTYLLIRIKRHTWLPGDHWYSDNDSNMVHVNDSLHFLSSGASAPQTRTSLQFSS